jgi:hypothetical protein
VKSAKESKVLVWFAAKGTNWLNFLWILLLLILLILDILFLCFNSYWNIYLLNYLYLLLYYDFFFLFLWFNGLFLSLKVSCGGVIYLIVFLLTLQIWFFSVLWMIALYCFFTRFFFISIAGWLIYVALLLLFTFLLLFLVFSLFRFLLYRVFCLLLVLFTDTFLIILNAFIF